MQRRLLGIIVISFLLSCGQNEQETKSVDATDNAKLSGQTIGDAKLIDQLENFIKAYQGLNFDNVVAYMYKMNLDSADKVVEIMTNAVNNDLFSIEVHNAWMDSLYPAFIIGNTHYAKTRIKMDLTLSMKQHDQDSDERILESLDNMAAQLITKHGEENVIVKRGNYKIHFQSMTNVLAINEKHKDDTWFFHFLESPENYNRSVLGDDVLEKLKEYN